MLPQNAWQNIWNQWIVISTQLILQMICVSTELAKIVGYLKMVRVDLGPGSMWIREVQDFCKVALGPKGQDKVGNVRITLGTYLDGSEFVEIDEWKNLEDVYVRNGKPWMGSTMFVDVTWLFYECVRCLAASARILRWAEGGVLAHNEHPHLVALLWCTFVGGNPQQYHCRAPVGSDDRVRCYTSPWIPACGVLDFRLILWKFSIDVSAG